MLKLSLTFGAVSLGLVATAPSHAQVDCGQWNTQAFFAAAGASVVGSCLDAGADPDAKNDERVFTTGDGRYLFLPGSTYDDNGFTPLHRAAGHNGDPAVIHILVQAGADPMARARYFATPLHVAAALNANPAVIDVLIAEGADAMARAYPFRNTADGITPLHWAAHSNPNPAVIERLPSCTPEIKSILRLHLKCEPNTLI